MLEHEPTSDDFWCPLPIARHAGAQAPLANEALSPEDYLALARVSSGAWLSDAHIDRLMVEGLVEKVFGRPLLTRRGRVSLGIRE